ncbi:hypothetical protein ACODUL_08280 [Stenotrophomonas maltophilia]
MPFKPAPILLVVLLLAASETVSGAPCDLSSLSIEAHKDGVDSIRIVSDISKGEANFFEGSPFSYTVGSVVQTDAKGVPLTATKSATTVDIGFKGVANCSGDRVLLDFSHSDLVGTQAVPMALTDGPSYPPILDYFKTTLVLDGRAGAEPERRTMNGWTYTFRVE